MAGISSKGTTLGVKLTTDATSYTTLGAVQDIPDVGGKPDKIDVTTLDDMKKYIAGLEDPGDLEFTLLYDNSGADSNYRVAKSIKGEELPWQITYPDGTTHAFTAAGFPIMKSAKTGEALTFSLTLILKSSHP